MGVERISTIFFFREERLMQIHASHPDGGNALDQAGYRGRSQQWPNLSMYYRGRTLLANVAHRAQMNAVRSIPFPFRFFLLVVIPVLCALPSKIAHAQSCGAEGQRACCVGEAAFGPCRSGLTEFPSPNAGRCGGFNPLGVQSSGICRQVTPCGGSGQRACCVGESSFGACQRGLFEAPQANSGQCAGALPGVQSSGICRPLTPCGGLGERACCVGESSFGACQRGLAEQPRANSGQCAGALPGIQSSGICTAVSPCGGLGERACCVGESSFGACLSGLVEVPRANSGQCAGAWPGIQSSGVCESVCGAEGQPPCRNGPDLPRCNAGLTNFRNTCVKSGQCGGRGQRPCTDMEAKPACKGAQLEIDGICQLPFDRKITILSNEGISTSSPFRFARARSRQSVIVTPINGMIEFDATDATFVRRRGLADRNCVSFESFRFPGRFLTAADNGSTISLEQRQFLEWPARSKNPFPTRATFCLRIPKGSVAPAYEAMGRPNFFLGATSSSLTLVQLSGSQSQGTNTLVQIEEWLGVANLALRYRGEILNAVENEGLLVVPILGECSPMLTLADVQDRLLGKPPRRAEVGVILDNVAKGAPPLSSRVVFQAAQTQIGTRLAPLLTLHLVLPQDQPAITTPSFLDPAGTSLEPWRFKLVAKIGRSLLPCEGEWADEDAKKVLRQQNVIP